jgi:uncharacterized DUF497 family protein
LGGDLAASFEWDDAKEKRNIAKHGLSFVEAQQAFLDPKVVIAVDEGHSRGEARYFAFGIVGDGIATVRFTLREGRIRIIGAGYWREGRRAYEKENRL